MNGICQVVYGQVCASCIPFLPRVSYVYTFADWNQGSQKKHPLNLQNFNGFLATIC